MEEFERKETAFVNKLLVQQGLLKLQVCATSSV